MKKKTAFVLVIGAVILCCTGYSNATVLGTVESNRAGSGLGEFSDMDFSIGYPIEMCEDDGHVLGIDLSTSLSWNITEADVGKTFFASADTHENFDNFTYLLTNGIDNGLFLPDNHSIFVGIPGPIEYESTLITGVQDGVDFEGYTIDSIALTVNELFFEYDPDGGIISNRGTTHYAYDITYTINGAETIHTPEPATLFLLGLGCLALRRRKRA